MSEYYIGEIRMFTRKILPAGWHLCDGATLPISEYQALFSLLGITYGGDGRTTFGLPDLQGRVVMGQGTAPTLTARVVGSTGGTETAIVNNSNQIPAHTHTVKATSATGTIGDPTNKMWASTGNTNLRQYSGTATTTILPDTNMGKDTLGKTGSGSDTPTPHDNIMPSLGINFIIALTGDYPPQS